jgi:hypothetical protein
MEVSLDTWREVLTKSRESAHLGNADLTYEDLWRSLTAISPEPDLLDALEVIQELGTDQGRDLLLYAADDQQVQLGAVDDVPARELAARVWLRSRTDSDLAQVLVRARCSALEAGRDRIYREFVGERAHGARALEPQRVMEAVSEWCHAQKKSEAVRVFVYERDGEWRCEIMRGEAVRRVVEIKDRRPEILNFRPAVADHLRYDPETGRLGIATRSPRLVQMYRELLGSLLAADTAFFFNENICTLKPLQEHGRSLFDRHRFPGIVRVAVVELRWRRGDRDKIWVKGPDCFKILADLEARLLEGELVEARLLVWFGGLGRRGQVTITVPGRIEINAGAKEHLVERLLDEVGIRGAFGVNEERLDLWSLYPWRLREELWRRLLGAQAFDRLVQQTALRSVRLEAVAHPDHPGVGGALAVEQLDELTEVGVSDDPAIGVRTLTSSDVTGYELDISWTAREIADELELEGTTREITSGVWSLGRRTLSTAIKVAVFLATRWPSDTSAHSARAVANGARPVLLVPLGRASDGDVPQIECRVPHGPYQGLLGLIVERLNVQDEVSPAVYRTEDLLLDPEKGLAWYRGVPLTKLQAGTHPYRFAEKVAGASGKLVTKDVLREHLSPANQDDSIVRKAKSDFVRLVRESFVEAGKECPPSVTEIFKAQAGDGYALKATAYIIP